MTYTLADYQREKAICDKARAYWEANATFSRGGWSSMSAELCAHPDYAAADNAMRGRVEQFEILRDLPDCVSVYVASDGRTLTTWTGDVLGYARETSRWRVNSAYGSHMRHYVATIGGREYSGRGFGAGMLLNLRAKRARAA